jgi:CheY-like chemotaxis protein
VVKKLIGMHGGRITARSEGLGGGSTFSIYLPRAQAPQADSCQAAVEMVGTHRILIVDDNADAGTSLSALLQLNGHETQTAFSSVDALSLAESFDPDIVLPDIGLPEMDGYEVARRLRRTPQGPRIHIIALTGYGQQADRDRARQAGFDGHLVKPLDFAALDRMLTHTHRP